MEQQQSHDDFKSRKGNFIIIRHTIKKWMFDKVLNIKQGLRKRMHMKVSIAGKWLVREVIT